MKNRVFAAVAALTLTASLTACGGDAQNTQDKGTDNGASAGEQVVAAQKKASEAKSVQMSMDSSVDMKISAQGQEQTVAYDTQMDMQILNNPMKAKGTITVDIDMGQEIPEQKIDIYLQEADGKATAYLGANGTWTKEELDASSTTYNTQASLDLYLSSADSFTEAGKEKVGEADATKFVGTIKGEKLPEVIEKSGMTSSLDQFAAMGVSEQVIDDIIQGLAESNLEVAVWVDTNGYPVQFETDMTEMMNNIMNKAMEVTGAAAQGVKIDVTDADVSINCSNFDKVEDFEIPAEALNA